MRKPQTPAEAPLRPITEGYTEKGGVNSNGRFDKRPPPPAAMKPKPVPVNEPSKLTQLELSQGPVNNSV